LDSKHIAIEKNCSILQKKSDIFEYRTEIVR
jgi:hypothetical protein